MSERSVDELAQALMRPDDSHFNELLDLLGQSLSLQDRLAKQLGADPGQAPVWVHRVPRPTPRDQAA